MTISAIEKSEGNPGALMVFNELIRLANNSSSTSLKIYHHTCKILNTTETHGSRLWILFKDVCHLEIGELVAICNVVRLGYIDTKTFKDFIDHPHPSQKELIHTLIHQDKIINNGVESILGVI